MSTDVMSALGDCNSWIRSATTRAMLRMCGVHHSLCYRFIPYNPLVL
jgi:hypothetical protein